MTAPDLTAAERTRQAAFRFNMPELEDDEPTCPTAGDPT